MPSRHAKALASTAVDALLARSLAPYLQQERLQQLKKEQADADTARETAWRQLKSVVSEISRLAGPEAALPRTSGTPTATAAV